MFMGFILYIIIIFCTNLLTGGPTHIAIFFAYFSISEKRNIKRSPNGMKPLGELFLEQTQSIDLEWTSRKIRGGHEEGRRACSPERAPHTRGPLVVPLTDFLRLYILIYPENIQEHHETLFPPPQPYVPKRSHLGAFSGALPEGASITEGLYINLVALLMKHE